MIELGDIVTDGKIVGEVLSLHPTYAIVVSEGKEYRLWRKDLSITETNIKRNQLYKNSLIYKGYRTKNFSRELAEDFKEIAQTHDDEYAVLSCLKAFDYVLGVDESTISEHYPVVKIQVERLRRYAKKIQCPHLVEKVISIVEEELMKYAILEGLKFITTDRIMVAKVIAMIAGTTINNIDPVTTVNLAVMKLKVAQLTTQGWELVGRMLKVADLAGIKWNHETFSPSQLKMMGY